METCHTCANWGLKEDSRLPLGAFRICSSPKIIKSITFPRGEFYPANYAVVEYDEEWGILTGPEFGCINHVAKE